MKDLRAIFISLSPGEFRLGVRHFALSCNYLLVVEIGEVVFLLWIKGMNEHGQPLR